MAEAYWWCTNCRKRVDDWQCVTYEEYHEDCGGKVISVEEEPPCPSCADKDQEISALRARAERAEAEQDSWRRVTERVTQERDAVVRELERVRLKVTEFAVAAEMVEGMDFLALQLYSILNGGEGNG